ncbi:MAG: HEAT repeat domain-containing protein [Candidatus Omnitrophica bacterium]|nr:HEAT repeat domain-containing protein [Candidatus Omnitrophota bacterium]
MTPDNPLSELLVDLEDFHPLTRKQAINKLTDLGDKSVIPKIIEILLNDKPALVRQAAAQYFQKNVSDKSSVPALIQSLKDPEEIVRGAAASALGAIKDKSAVIDLCAALKDESQHVRWAAIHNLAKIGDKAAINALIELINDPEEILNIKDSAKEALRQLRLC